MDFSEALLLAKEGWLIGNSEWDGEMVFGVYRPKKFQTVSVPYLYRTEEGIGTYPWQPDQIDIMSESYVKLNFSTQDFM